ncbi:tail protein [Thermus phage phiKo]|nr:tail protein [Thermus phage phiKo]
MSLEIFPTYPEIRTEQLSAVEWDKLPNLSTLVISVIRNAPTITPSPGDWLLGVLAGGTEVGKLPIGQADGVPLLNASGALASADAYLSRGSVTSAVDWNTLTNAGTYEIASGAFGTGSANTPPAVTQQGHLLVLKTSGATTQVYVPKSADPGIYWRQYAGGTWSSWATAGVMYGSNSNGSYIRFADGTQICWREATWEMPTGWSTGPSVPWPAAFVATPRVWLNYTRSGWRIILSDITNNSTTIQLSAYNFDTTVTPYRVDILAIGRWK